jgi:NADH:ubiquinone oxidoreductase subunit 6 (subunit J)
MTHVPRYVPAKTNEGWPVVGLIGLLTAALIVMVVIIHNKTYRPPTDPVSPARASSGATTH